MHQLFNIHIFYIVSIWETPFFGTSASYGIVIKCFGHYVELACLVLFLGGLILHHAPSPTPHGWIEVVYASTLLCRDGDASCLDPFSQLDLRVSFNTDIQGK